MFARAMEGRADLDGDGVLRRSKLWRFVRENVRTVSEARQTPNLLPDSPGGEPILRVAASRPGSAVGSPGGTAFMSPAGPIGAERRLRLAVHNASPEMRASARNTLPGVAIVPQSTLPDLIKDAAARLVVTGLGDVAAHGIDLAARPAAVGKWEAVRTVRVLSARDGLRLRVRPHDGLHRQGSVIEIEIGGLRQPRITLIGISGNGTVQHLYPLPRDREEIPLDRPFRLELPATPPFGADHVVAASA